MDEQEFEGRVSASLHGAAEGAGGDGAGLAQGARARLRRRRRTTLAAAAAALVVVAVPVGVQVAGGDDGDDRSTVATDPVASGGAKEPAAPEWRAESWRDATVQVPADWRHGALAAWCAGAGEGGSPQPVVERPTTVAPMIACEEPTSGYGVRFEDARAIMLASNEEVPAQVDEVGGPAQYPAGAWVGYKVVGGTLVSVVAPDQGTATRVYDSIAVLEGPDANGCPMVLGDAEAAGPTGDAGLVSLCRYSDADELDASVLLDMEQSERLVGEVERSPQTAVRSDCAGFGPPTAPTVILLDGGYFGLARLDDPCPARNGVFVDGAVHRPGAATRDLLQLP